jgi:hypothetical protein
MVAPVFSLTLTLSQNGRGLKLNYSAAKLTGYQNIAMRIYPNGVTPECFNRGFSSGLAWIPDRCIREDGL